MGTSISLPEQPISVLCGPKPANGTATIRNPIFKDLPESKLVELPFPNQPDVVTAFHAFRKSVLEHPANPCLGRRPITAGKAGDFVFESYAEVGAQVEALGAAFVGAGFGRGAPVGIFAANRVEWTKALLAIWGQGLTCVPLYDTLGASSVEFVVNDAQVTLLFVAADKLTATLQAAKNSPCLRTVVVFDGVTPALEAEAAETAPGVVLVTFADFVARGVATPVPAAPPQAEELAYIMYTSGTTGNPKGVMLSHRNILASVSGLFRFGVEFRPDDVYLSYLPLAHSFETVMQVLSLTAGGCIGFYQGDVRRLTDDIMALRPTVFAGVPRVYSRIYERTQATLAEASFVKKTLFDRAFRVQSDNITAGLPRSEFWDNLVFSKTAERLGGRIRVMCTGAAPMPSHLHTFMQVVFCAPMLQGYGMTENAAAAAGTPLGYRHPGRIGTPLPCTEMKLEDIPEMNYLSTDHPHPRGEVCMRGPNVFKGYYNLPDKTAEALDADGWLHTGDVGRLNDDGSLSIIDRKKNIFKLAQGEYVAAEELEGIFGKASIISQIFVYGDSFKTVLVAIVVVSVEALKPWAAAAGMAGDFATLCQDDRVRKHVMAEIVRESKAAAVASFKVPKAIFLEPNINELGQGFSVENDTLTPTFKLRRPQLQKKYQAQIDALYVQCGEGATSASA